MIPPDRLQQLYRRLGTRLATPASELQETLGISRATLTRYLRDLRDRLGAPIVFDRDQGGYRLARQSPDFGPQFEIPGLWFTAEEIHALLTMQYLLSTLDTGGLLGPHIQPLLSRLGRILGTSDASASEVARRIRIQTVGARHFELEHFQTVGSATLRRQRLMIEYHARGKDETTRREVSPQRLIHYRDNWYLDAWCHLRNELRSFAVDAIGRAEILDLPAQEIDAPTLDQVLGAGYGIFAGQEVRWAVLRFSSERSRWVATEKWHPNQQGRRLDNGGFELKVPYSQEPELIMDILRHGRHVEVLEPASLREAVRREHVAAAGENS
ncbi:MAG: WYL domain-containing protein [Rhodocyclaceae bacterium]|nr:WYL domain-containing protein [Rhodocyclaceae bacterium]